MSLQERDISGVAYDDLSNALTDKSICVITGIDNDNDLYEVKFGEHGFPFLFPGERLSSLK